MINLFFTCLACFLPFLPFDMKARDVDRSEFLVNESSLKKNVFEKQEFHYYSLNDITNKRFQTALQDWMWYDLGPSNIWNYSVTYNEESFERTQDLTNAQTTRLGIGFIDNINDIYTETPLSNLEYPTYAQLNYSYVQGNTYYSKAIAFFFSDNSYYVIRYRQYFANINLVNGEFFNGSFAIGSTYAVNRNSTNSLVLYEGSLYNILKDNDNVSLDYDRGYKSGFDNGYDSGLSNGYQRGYADGLDTLDDTNTTASTIFEGIFDVGLLPVNVFLTIFNFDVFGVNIAGIVSGLLTLAVVVIILRFLLGGKKDDK